jgi:hypothetical protein
MQYILRKVTLKLEIDYIMERRLRRHIYDRDKDVITKRRDESDFSDLLNGIFYLRRQCDICFLVG